MKTNNWNIRVAATCIVVIFICFVVTACTSISRMIDKNGTYIIVQLEREYANDQEAIDTAIKVLNRRMYFAGISGEVSNKHPEATKPNQIVIDIYGSRDVESIRDYLLRRSDFQIRAVKSEPAPAFASHPTREEAEKTMTGTQEVVPHEQSGLNGFLVLEKEPIVLGTEIRNASLVRNDGAEDYSIQFSLNPKGAEKFGTWTENNINQYIATVFNEEVISIAFIESKITDAGMINGTFTKKEADDLATQMSSGYFPHTLELVDEKRYGK